MVSLTCNRCKTVRDINAPIIPQWQVMTVQQTPDQADPPIYYICQLCVVDLATFFANDVMLAPQPERNDPGDPNT